MPLSLLLELHWTLHARTFGSGSNLHWRRQAKLNAWEKGGGNRRANKCFLVGGGDYSSPLWGVCNKTFKGKLQKFQYRAAKIIAGVSFDTRSADVLRSLSWNELEVKRRISKSLLIYKILNDYTRHNLKESLIRKNIWQTNYDLRNSQTDLAVPKPKREFLKKVLIIVGQNCGTVFHRMPN